MAEKKEKKERGELKPERPGGFLDFLPKDYLAREKMINTISGVFRSFGFDPIETPRVEFLKTLAGEESDTGKNIFYIKSSSDSEPLALPFDHTVPFARLLAANPYNAKDRSGIRLPWRRMVVGPVFRGEKPQSGRYRQFYQIDADIAGSDSMLADSEIVTMIYRTLTELGVKKFLIRLNNRKILNGLAELAGIKKRKKVSCENITREMMHILDKIDKIGLDGVVKELQKKPESDFDPAPFLSNKAVDKVRVYLAIKGTNKEKLNRAKDVFKDILVAKTGIEELEEILSFLNVLAVPEKFISIDFSIARGLDYYTGPVMETVLLEAREFGSIFGGGRYDALVKRFTGENLPAVGASIGFDRMFAALNHLGLIDNKKQSVADVLVLRLAKDKDAEYFGIAQDIRACGFNTELCLYPDTTFKNQFNFALSRGVKYVVICGESEFDSDMVAVKDLDKRKQVEVKRKNLKDYFNKLK
ncbi:MAG: histidine--tRNA ligase [Patescibacteria group bacterium]|nr:histidine--tRNA ligase [Patescibacteria group bacterium]